MTGKQLSFVDTPTLKDEIFLFQCFLQNKAATMTVKGGNTDTVYNTNDNRFEFADSLRKNHPDVVTVVKRYGRWHHDVNYSSFLKNKLQYVDGYKRKEGINEFGMVLKNIGANYEQK